MTGKSARTSFLIRLLQLKIYNEMVEGLRQFDITPFQYMALSLASHDGKWSAADLARRFQIRPQSMNEVIAALEAKELIAREEAPDHGRILHVRLTGAGTRLLNKCDREIDRIEGMVFVGFTGAEVNAFRKMLYRALAGLDRSRRGELALASPGIERSQRTAS